MMILLESLHASDEVSGPIFVKKFRMYIYTYFYTVFIHFKCKKCIFYEFYVSLNVYLQCTMFDLMS